MAKELQQGDKIVFHNTKKNRENTNISDITFGKIYEVTEGYGEFYVFDDAGDANYACNPETGAGKWTKIVD